MRRLNIKTDLFIPKLFGLSSQVESNHDCCYVCVLIPSDKSKITERSTDKRILEEWSNQHSDSDASV